MLLRLSAAGLLLLAGSLAIPTQCLAQNNGDRLDDAARAVFDAGAEAYDAGLIEEALRRFENAYELSGRSLIIYNVALCLDRLDRREEATAAYARFLREAPNAPRVPLARARLTALRDSEAGEATGTAAALPEEERLRENQGPEEEQNPEGGTSDANDEAADATPVDADAQDEAADYDELAAPAATSPSLVGPIAVLGVGGAGLVTFAIAGILAGSSHDKAADACRMGTCDEDALSAMDRRALIADIGLGLGIAGAVAGTTWLILALTGADEDDPRASVAPFATPSTAGLQASGSF